MTFARVLLALALGLSPAIAVAEWRLEGNGASCRIAFDDEAVDDGIFFVEKRDADCGPFARITGYAVGEGGEAVVFWSTLDTVEQVGRAVREAEGRYSGNLRSGGNFILVHLSGPTEIPDPAGDLVEEGAPPAEPAAEPAPQGGTASVSSCLRFAGNRPGCAEDDNMGPPEAELQVLSRMNLRALASTTAQIVTRLEPGQCLPVIGCEEVEGRLWCQVETAGQAGWMLKQDAETVYALNRCE
ncbi:MAG: SH3 domain-containing protein [Gemmobacter sp.]